MPLSNVIIVGGWLLILVTVFVGCWHLADMIVPQSEIDKVNAIGKWAKEELERRREE